MTSTGGTTTTATTARMDECRACNGDGCTWHPSPTNGATEIDGPCPSCAGTGKAPR